MNYYLRHSFALLRQIVKNPLNLYWPISYAFYVVIGKRKVIKKVPVLKNFKMVLDLDSHVDRSIFFRTAFTNYIHADLLLFLRGHLKKNSTFFDIGANSGYFSLFASQISKNGFIHAFEPVPYTFQNLQKTVLINNLHNIKVNRLAVGKKNSLAKFYVSFHTDVSGLKVTSYQRQNKTVICRMTTLDSYIRKNNVKTVDMIKIDTEGGEKDILMSSKKILENDHPILIVEFCNDTAKPFEYHPNENYDFLIRLGYKAYRLEENKLVLQARKEYYKDEDLIFIYRQKTPR